VTKDEQDRIAETKVRVCAKDHPTVTYYVRRDGPEPACPACVVRDQSGRPIAPPQTPPATRPAGPHDGNCDARKPVRE